ncbi:hypothetical protein Fcan01_18646 [Folsomia candida]|uniref:Uncharacterized protein n=1 Tax=Folsomia candida TaxID=158441 RepID=A0A226DPR3_FOLCA|nr:hypothetical protein Fcan01_18646 [Folsomia candida]
MLRTAVFEYWAGQSAHIMSNRLLYFVTTTPHYYTTVTLRHQLHHTNTHTYSRPIFYTTIYTPKMFSYGLDWPPEPVKVEKLTIFPFELNGNGVCFVRLTLFNFLMSPSLKRSKEPIVQNEPSIWTSKRDRAGGFMRKKTNQMLEHGLSALWYDSHERETLTRPILKKAVFLAINYEVLGIRKVAFA